MNLNFVYYMQKIAKHGGNALRVLKFISFHSFLLCDCIVTLQRRIWKLRRWVASLFHHGMNGMKAHCILMRCNYFVSLMLYKNVICVQLEYNHLISISRNWVRILRAYEGETEIDATTTTMRTTFFKSE